MTDKPQIELRVHCDRCRKGMHNHQYIHDEKCINLLNRGNNQSATYIHYGSTEYLNKMLNSVSRMKEKDTDIKSIP